jgi:cytochrome P450
MSLSDQIQQETDPQDLSLPPYPDATGHPLTHSFRTMRNPLSFRDASMQRHDTVRNYLFGVGDIYNFSLPSHFKRVLVDDRESFGKSDDFRIAFGDGLVASEGTQWKQQREILQPLFSQGKIDSYVPEMIEQIHRRTEAWNDGETIDLQRQMRRLTLDTLFATLFGRELELGDSEIHDAATHLHDWFSPTSYPLPKWVPTPARRRFKKSRRKLRTIADQILSEKSDESRPLDDEPADLLSVLVELQVSGKERSVLSDEQLRDQIVTLIFAGHDTTASTLALALYELSRHEIVRERFHEEVDGLSEPITRGTLDSLEVTERIVTETLRLYPPVYILPRESERTLAMDGYRVPNGVPVWLGIRQVHHDERFYDSPDEFRPSRWQSDLKQSLPDFAYAPFGGGPRLCIGRQFALTEAQLALAIIGRKYTLSRTDTTDGGDRNRGPTIPDPPLTADMTLRLTPGTEFYVSDR